MPLFADPAFDFAFGIVFMFVLGISAGNFATSFVHRLPRGLVIAGDPPYCECERRAYLEKRDMFPLFSWLANRGRCRFCGIRIPGTYTVMEGLSGVLFSTNYFLYGIGQPLVLVLFLEVVWMTIAAIYVSERRLFPVLLLAAAGLSGIYRTLLDGSIYPFMSTAYMSLLAGLGLWLLMCLRAGKRRPFPPFVVVLAVGGMSVVEGRELLLYLMLSAVVAVLVKLAAFRREPDWNPAWMIGVCVAVLFMHSLWPWWAPSPAFLGFAEDASRMRAP